MNVSFNWEHKEIGKALKLLSGYPFASANFSSEEGFPLIRIRDILSSNIETYYQGSFIPSYVIEFDDILIGMDGDFNIAKWKGANALLNQRVLKVDVRNINDFDLDFIFYWLQPYIKKINDITAATTVKHLSIKDIVKAESKLPCIVAQRKIGKILSTIDQTIEKTEALIAKYQLIKSGLMHDLFTRGIGADGKLRPPRAQAPELYYETEIGWIPNDWSCDLLENVLAPLPNNIRSGPFGSALLKSELVEDGIPFLGIDNIHVENFIQKYKRFVSERKFSELQKYAVRPKDVVITIMGTVGRCAVIPDSIERALSSKHLWAMSFDQSLVIPELICWQLNYASWVKSWFRRETQGGIMDAIQSKTLKKLNIPIPPIEEQKEIYKRYAAISCKLDVEQNNLEKLEKNKAGLMHDLLTGKITVTIDDDSNDSEAAHV